MLQACLNGGLSRDDHPAVPDTPAAIASDAAAVRAAGADDIHIHVRDELTEQSLHPDVMDETLGAIARVAPGMTVSVSTGKWIKPGGRARHAHIAAWRTVPQFGAVNIHEEDFDDVTALLRSKGTGIEIGLWNAADVEQFLAAGIAGDCARILVEITIPDVAAALDDAGRALDLLAAADTGLPILMRGEGPAFWPCLELAARRGIGGRVGFEDIRTLPDGAIAPDNAALVAVAAGILAGATPPPIAS